MLLSMPLLKQSIKANFIRWAVVTGASCFIVAVVILILGNLNVNEIKGSLEDLFESSSKQSEIKIKATDSYQKVYDIYIATLDNYDEMTGLLERAINGEITEDEIADFPYEFKNAINKIRNGEIQIADAKEQILAGENKLTESKATFASSKASALSNKSSLQSTQKQLEDGIESAKKGKQDLEEKLNTVDSAINKFSLASNVVDAISEYKTTSNDTKEEKNNSIEYENTKKKNGILYDEKDVKSLKIELDTIDSQIDKINRLYDAADVVSKVVLKAELDDLNSKKELIEDGLKQYDNGIAEAQDNLRKVKTGIATIDSKLNEGQKQITTAENQLSTSKEKIESAMTELEDGKNELRAKTLDSLYDQITEAVFEEALKENDVKTAIESRNLAKEILNKRRKNDELNEDIIRKIAKTYVAEAIYDEALKEVSGDDAITAKEIAATAIDEYNNKVDYGATKEEALKDISKTLIDQLPDEVEDAIVEIRDMDVYGLVVGNILFRIAGLLLPMIFVILTATNLLAGQVDSGSMAYILSTPTKRSKVTSTQMVYLILSVLIMYVCICLTSIICMVIIRNSEMTLTISQVIKFNLGAFFVMFAISGICYLFSAVFNREKDAISVGGGLTMFFLVCSILGLFGEKVIPSAIRIKALNFFNYISIITLFNAHSMLDGSNDYIMGLIILFIIGIISYIVGIVRFDGKDLPL